MLGERWDGMGGDGASGFRVRPLGVSWRSLPSHKNKPSHSRNLAWIPVCGSSPILHRSESGDIADLEQAFGQFEQASILGREKRPWFSYTKMNSRKGTTASAPELLLFFRCCYYPIICYLVIQRLCFSHLG